MTMCLFTLFTTFGFKQTFATLGGTCRHSLLNYSVCFVSCVRAEVMETLTQPADISGESEVRERDLQDDLGDASIAKDLHDHFAIPLAGDVAAGVADSLALHFPVDPDLERLGQHLFDSAAAAIQRGVRMLVLREDAVRELEVGANKHISIVSHWDDHVGDDQRRMVVSFINWDPPAAALRGQIVHPSRDGTIKFTNFVDQYKKLQRPIIVHPDVGVRLVKAKHDRERISDDLMLLFKMWSLALSNADPIQSTLHACQVCNRPGVDERPLATCAMCMHTWHAQCCNDVVIHNRRLQPVAALLPTVELPEVFCAGVMCAFCVAVCKRD
jgi:hypothetical protein